MRPNIKTIHVINFGSPRTGDNKFEEFASNFKNLSIHRVVNNADVICRIPRLGYKHVGHAILVNDLPGVPPKGYKWNDGVPSGTWNLLYAHSPADHSMTKYVEAIHKTVQEKTEPCVISYAPSE